MDERLKKAISKGTKKRETEYKKELDKKRIEQEKKEKHIASFAKQADEWINNNLFDLIAKAEKEGKQSISLPSASEIPQEAMINAIRKIQGLAVTSEWINYCDDYGKIEEWYVSWAKPKQTSIYDILPYNYRAGR